MEDLLQCQLPYTRQTDHPVPIIPINEQGLDSWLNAQPARIRNWVENNRFSGRPGTQLRVPDEEGGLHAVLVGARADKALFSLAHLPSVLPAGAFQLACGWPDDACKRARLGWGLVEPQRCTEAMPLFNKVLQSAYAQKPTSAEAIKTLEAYWQNAKDECRP